MSHPFHNHSGQQRRTAPLSEDRAEIPAHRAHGAATICAILPEQRVGSQQIRRQIETGAKMTHKTMETPKVALGTWAWGDSGEAGDGYFGSALSRDGLNDIAGAANAAGFTLWDTATVYGMGRSETVLGEVLKRYNRSDYQLSTKFTPQAAGPGDNPVADMLEQSLARLGTDYVDLYWIHNPADVERWTPHVIPLLASGKIRHVGVSNHNLDDIKRTNEILGSAGHQVEAVQNHYSLLYRAPEAAGVLEYCSERNIPFFAYMVLEQGALSGKYSPQNPLPSGTNRAEVYNSLLPRLQILTDRLTAIGGRHQATAADIATAWAIAKGTTPIIGITRTRHVEGLIRASKLALSGDELAELEALAQTAGVNTRGWWEKEL
jgi:aryl-alcohol dehydrogenase-like predicted oxidoreductase